MKARKVCVVCNTQKAEGLFCKDNRLKSGRSGTCKDCHNESRKERRRVRWKEDKQYRAKREESNARWVEKYKNCETTKNKRAARDKVQKAIKSGKLIRPKKCEHCEVQGPLEAHHTDYAEPLKVNWLCRTCHGREHTGER